MDARPASNESTATTRAAAAACPTATGMVSAMIVPQRRAASRRVMRGLGHAPLARRATRGTSAAVRAAALFLSGDCQEESDDLSPLLSFPFLLRFFVLLVVSLLFLLNSILLISNELNQMIIWHLISDFLILSFLGFLSLPLLISQESVKLD
jgi:hypothetical protein